MKRRRKNGEKIEGVRGERIEIQALTNVIILEFKSVEKGQIFRFIYLNLRI